MPSIKDKDYVHSNDRGNLPKERMEGGDETDDIDINNPDLPWKKKPKEEDSRTVETPYTKP